MIHMRLILEKVTNPGVNMIQRMFIQLDHLIETFRSKNPFMPSQLSLLCLRIMLLIHDQFKVILQNTKFLKKLSERVCILLQNRISYISILAHTKILKIFLSVFPKITMKILKKKSLKKNHFLKKRVYPKFIYNRSILIQRIFLRKGVICISTHRHFILTKSIKSSL